jgi:hypothetical protein
MSLELQRVVGAMRCQLMPQASPPLVPFIRATPFPLVFIT